ncbi:protein ORF6 [Cyprinid herpesvirus 3]|nr:protein ORF6 [Cyprinid herpesvirus 3]AOO33505.1 protein ORF6 [Cyprinid herpesvirus 3]
MRFYVHSYEGDAFWIKPRKNGDWEWKKFSAGAKHRSTVKSFGPKLANPRKAFNDSKNDIECYHVTCGNSGYLIRKRLTDGWWCAKNAEGTPYQRHAVACIRADLVDHTESHLYTEWWFEWCSVPTGTLLNGRPNHFAPTHTLTAEEKFELGTSPVKKPDPKLPKTQHQTLKPIYRVKADGAAFFIVNRNAQQKFDWVQFTTLQPTGLSPQQQAYGPPVYDSESALSTRCPPLPFKGGSWILHWRDTQHCLYKKKGSDSDIWMRSTTSSLAFRLYKVKLCHITGADRTWWEWHVMTKDEVPQGVQVRLFGKELEESVNQGRNYGKEEFLSDFDLEEEEDSSDEEEEEASTSTTAATTTTTPAPTSDAETEVPIKTEPQDTSCDEAATEDVKPDLAKLTAKPEEKPSKKPAKSTPPHQQPTPPPHQPTPQPPQQPTKPQQSAQIPQHPAAPAPRQMPSQVPATSQAEGPPTPEQNVMSMRYYTTDWDPYWVIDRSTMGPTVWTWFRPPGITLFKSVGPPRLPPITGPMLPVHNFTLGQTSFILKKSDWQDAICMDNQWYKWRFCTMDRQIPDGLNTASEWQEFAETSTPASVLAGVLEHSLFTSATSAEPHVPAPLHQAAPAIPKAKSKKRPAPSSASQSAEPSPKTPKSAERIELSPGSPPASPSHSAHSAHSAHSSHKEKEKKHKHKKHRSERERSEKRDKSKKKSREYVEPDSDSDSD